MLKQHANLPSPRSNQLRVGRYTLDVARRELTGPAVREPLRITLKSEQVLLVLAAHPGKVVSREALLEWVWADTMPTDDVVTQAIAGLRRAFAGDPDNPAYVETIPKSGYRLVVPVAWLEDADAPVLLDHADSAAGSTSVDRPVSPAGALQPQGEAVGKRATLGWTLGLGVLAAAALLAAGLAWQHAARKQEPQAVPTARLPSLGSSAPVLLTSQPGYEQWPVLSPDGTTVAFTMASAANDRGAIHLQVTEPAPATQLTFPAAGETDAVPRWAPDGRRLMFMRIGADREDCRFMVVALTGGEPKLAGRCAFNGSPPGYDWLPDASGVVAPARLAGVRGNDQLHVLSLQTGKWRRLDYAASTGDVDVDPRYSPDGKTLGFRRNVSNSSIWLLPKGGKAPRRLTHLQGNILGWDWMPDARGLVFSHLSSTPRLIHADVATGKLRDLGVDDVLAPDVAAHTPRLVFEVHTGRYGVVEVDLDGAAKPRQLFASSKSEQLPSRSPDGRQLAFLSDRSGQLRLWVAAFDGGSAPWVVDQLDPMPRQSPQWSPDGTRLWLVGSNAGDALGQRQAAYRIELASGRAEVVRMPFGQPLLVQPMPGGRLLAVVDRGEGRISLLVLDIAPAGARVLARLDDVAMARHDPASDAVYFVKSNAPGLWRTGTALGPATLVDATRPTAYWDRRWGVAKEGAFLLGAAPSDSCQMQLEWLERTPPIAPRCLDQAQEAVSMPDTANPHRKAYVTVPIGDQGKDVALLDFVDSKDASD